MSQAQGCGGLSSIDSAGRWWPPILSLLTSRRLVVVKQGGGARCKQTGAAQQEGGWGQRTHLTPAWSGRRIAEVHDPQCRHRRASTCFQPHCRAFIYPLLQPTHILLAAALGSDPAAFAAARAAAEAHR